MRRVFAGREPALCMRNVAKQSVPTEKRRRGKRQDRKRERDREGEIDRSEKEKENVPALISSSFFAVAYETASSNDYNDVIIRHHRYSSLTYLNCQIGLFQNVAIEKALCEQKKTFQRRR